MMSRWVLDGGKKMENVKEVRKVQFKKSWFVFSMIPHVCIESKKMIGHVKNSPWV